MRWNWQRSDWPNFRYDAPALTGAENQFLLSAGALIGVYRHVGADDRTSLKIEMLSDEAVMTSAIEGET